MKKWTIIVCIIAILLLGTQVLATPIQKEPICKEGSIDAEKPNLVIKSVVLDSFDGKPLLKMIIKNEGNKNFPPDSPVEIKTDVKLSIFSLITIYTNKVIFLPDNGIAIGQSVTVELSRPPVFGIHKCIFQIGREGILNENPKLNSRYSVIFAFTW